VLTVRGEDGASSAPDTIDRILVPVDFSDYSRDALRHAEEWAALYGASLDVLHVVAEDLHPAFYVGGVQSVYDVEPEIEQKVLDKLDSFVAEANGRAAEVQTHVRVGNGAPSNIAEFVEDQAIDLVSMSTHGRTGLDRFLLGSVAEKVVRHVQCPVLTVKAFGESIVSAESGNGAKIGGRRPRRACRRVRALEDAAETVLRHAAGPVCTVGPSERPSLETGPDAST